MEQKAVCEITDMDTSKYLYRYNGHLINWIVAPDKNHRYVGSKTYWRLYWGDWTVADVTGYTLIDVEPMPTVDVLRQRLKAMIDIIPDDEIYDEYCEMSNAWRDEIKAHEVDNQ